MSVSYIDLSSDEEIEIVTEKKICPNTNNNPTIGSSAVEKLKRNSNIELTIDLEKSNPEKENEKAANKPKETEKVISKPKENGFPTVNKLQGVHTPTPKHMFNGNCVPQKNNVIPEVIVIDGDDIKDEVQPEKKKETSPSSGKEVITKSNINADKTSKMVVENGDEVFIIDDDDDDDDATVSTVQPSQTPKSKELSDVKKKDLSRVNETIVTKIWECAPHINTEKNCNQKADVSLPQNRRNSTPVTSQPSTPVTTASSSVNNKMPTLVVPLHSIFSNSSTSSSKSLSTSKNDEIVILSDEPDPKEFVRELRPRQKVEPQKASSLPSAGNQQKSKSSTQRASLPSTGNQLKSHSSTQRASLPAGGNQPKSLSSTKSNSSLRDSNGNSSGPSTSKTLVPKVDLSNDNATTERINSYSVENMFDGLVKVSCKLFQDENLGTRLWRYFRSASEDVLKSDEFLNAVKLALNSAENDKNTSFEDKVIVSRNLKEVMRILKRQPERVNRTLRKLNKMLQMLNERIRKLEAMEVTSSSDEETENIYCLLDRHRVRAAKIYSKICELQGKAAHAGRATLQKFHFSGTSGYTKIEHALEKYFNKTRLFPDFLDVKKLIEMTVEKEKLQISPTQIHNIAQSVFLEFGNKLQRMRKCDDYTMLVDYLDDGTKDPALDDEELFRKLEENKKTMKKEEEVLSHFVKKQVELKTKGEIKTDEEDAVDNSEGEDSEKEDGESEKKNLQFSDTEDELINEDVESERKRKLSPDREASTLPPQKRTMTELDEMEVNLKLVADVEEARMTRRSSSNSAEKDLMMDQLGLESKGKRI